MNPEWTHAFFQGLALELWRRVNPPQKTRAEADFLEGVLGVPAGAALLDAPCGNGRLALALAARGYTVTGVDLAGPFVAEARAQAEAEGASAEFHVRDMRELPWPGRFDGAWCLGNSFGYFDPDGTRAFVRAVAGALRPGGRFVLDTEMAAESLLPDLQERMWVEAGDLLLLVENHYRAAASRLDSTYTFIQEGAPRETRHATHWVYTVGAITRMLEAVGLETLSLFASLEQAPYEVGAPLLLLVAEKRDH